MATRPKKALELGWPELNALLMTATESDVAALVRAELVGRNRLRVLLRLYARFSKLRRQRETRELGQGRFKP